MVWKINENVWFDSEKLYIIKGKENYDTYMVNRENYAPINRKSHRSKFPTIVFLSSTSCNLKCTYCFAHEGTYNSISDNKFFKSQDYIEVFESAVKQYGGVNAISFFGGEPMLNISEIEKFVMYLHKNCDRVPTMAISSNGTIMNSRIKEFLKMYGIHFCTSLDGPKNLNDSSRLGDGIDSVYDKVEKTLRYISDLPIKKALQITIGKNHVEGYKKGDVVSWLKEIEDMGIDNFELVPVTTEDPKYKIDIRNQTIRQNYINLCNDYADYCLNLLENSGGVKATSNMFVGLILHIIKRVYQEDCSAGFSFCVSPDLIAYPCHVCASDEDYGIRYSEKFIHDIKYNDNFQTIKDFEKSSIEECKSCMATNLCSYICKGLSAESNYTLPKERCLMMRIFLKKVIVFLAESYESKSKIINKNILLINSGGINV